jgi:hypothetical protein
VPTQNSYPRPRGRQPTFFFDYRFFDYRRLAPKPLPHIDFTEDSGKAIKHDARQASNPAPVKP